MGAYHMCDDWSWIWSRIAMKRDKEKYWKEIMRNGTERSREMVLERRDQEKWYLLSIVW